jgi:hypothetical protein
MFSGLDMCTGLICTLLNMPMYNADYAYRAEHAHRANHMCRAGHAY